METIELFISGKVQGVFFRQRTREKALELGLTGSVCNLEDGRVRVIATGTGPQLQKLAAWCSTGPERARVDGVQSSATALQTL